jgi:MFS family permease
MSEQARVGITAGWNQPGLRLLMISGGIRGLFMGWAFYAAQPYFLELLDRDAVWVVGLVTAGVSAFTIVGNRIVERVSQRCGRRTTLLLGSSAVTAAAAVVIGLTSSFWVACLGLFAVAVAMGVAMPVRQAYLHQVTASEHRATVISFDALVGSLGGGGGQIGLGRLAEERSYGAGYVVGGTIAGLAVPVLWLLRHRGEEADHLGPHREEAGVDGSCPAGLPREAGVQSQSAAVVRDETVGNNSRYR